MTSMHGVFQYFDYDSFQKESCRVPSIDKFQYPPGTIMGVLQEERPRFAQIATMSKYDRKFADPQARFTVFVSDYWEHFSPAEIDRLDVDACKKIIMYNTVNGRIRGEDLRTSLDSQLFSLQDGVLIHIWLDRRDSVFKKDDDRIVSQRDATNGIIHFIEPILDDKRHPV